MHVKSKQRARNVTKNYNVGIVTMNVFVRVPVQYCWMIRSNVSPNVRNESLQWFLHQINTMCTINYSHARPIPFNTILANSLSLVSFDLCKKKKKLIAGEQESWRGKLSRIYTSTLSTLSRSSWSPMLGFSVSVA